MILAIDMGNTNTVIGGIDEERTYFIERVTTDQGRTDTEYAVSFKNILEMNQIDVSSIEGAILSSVVPPLNSTIMSAVKKVTGISPLLVGSGMKTGMNIIMDNPKTVGAMSIPCPLLSLTWALPQPFARWTRRGIISGASSCPDSRFPSIP